MIGAALTAHLLRAVNTHLNRESAQNENRPLEFL